MMVHLFVMIICLMFGLVSSSSAFFGMVYIQHCFVPVMAQGMQGGFLSPKLFVHFIRELVCEIVSARVGCNVGYLFINILPYADDLVLIASSQHALQHLVDSLGEEATKINMTCNAKKTMCMVFSSCKSM
jgi:hypothetical protein